MPVVRFVTDGAHGHSGSHGSSGYSGGGRGGDGSPGGHGSHAGDITIALRPDGGRAVVSGTHQGSVGFGDCNKMHLSAVGGNGGRGGDGGCGGTGTRGTDGRDASQYSAGTSGGSGGPGGRGGDGGRGGNAGNGGHIRVKAADDDMDLFMLLEERPKCHAGTPGAGGSGGSGGAGGPGGRGGSGCSWTTSTSYTDSNGNRQTRTEYHSQPGGMSGSTGMSGSSGSSGARGNAGRDGSFGEVITWNGGESTSQHDWRYSAQVRSHHFIDLTTQDGIFEPDENCECTYHVANVGKMPTPKVQYILANIYATQWIQNPQGSRVQQRLIKVGNFGTLERPIAFHLSDTREPAPNTRFSAQTAAKWDVSVERVNKHFRDDELGAPHTLTIQWPAKVSRLHGAAVIARSEEAPLVFNLHNMCTKSLGAKAGRVLRVHAGIVRDAGSMHPLAAPQTATMRDERGVPIPDIDVPVGELQMRGNLLPGTMVTFGPDAKQYDRVTVGSELFLGKVHSMLDERRIQRMSIDVQLAEYYSGQRADGEERKDLLFATSHSTTRPAYLAWHSMASDLGLEGNTWNVTMHDGLSLVQTVNGTRLVDDFEDRTIVIENNTPAFLTTVQHQQHASKRHAAETIPAREVVKAMRDHRVSFVAVGQSPPLRHVALPVDDTNFAIPQPESVFLRRNAKWWIQRIRTRIRYAADINPPRAQELQERHKKLAKSFGCSDGTAWYLLWGSFVARNGERPEPLSRACVKDPVERVRGVLAAYMPTVSDAALKALSTAAKSAKGAAIDACLQPLTASHGGEEFVWAGNEFEYVYAIVRPGRLTQASAKRILGRAAVGFHHEIEKLRPQWKFVVQYECAPHVAAQGQQQQQQPSQLHVGSAKIPLERQQSVPTLQRMLIGRLSIHRSADRNDIATYNTSTPPSLSGSGAKPIDPTAVEESLLLVLKGLPFHRKLERTCEPAFHERRNSSLAMADALLSDLAEEQASLRRAQWTGPVSDRTLLDHCPRLCAFASRVQRAVGAGHNATTRQVVSTLTHAATRLRALIGRWTRWHDHVMLNRRWRALNAATKPVVEGCLRLLATMDAKTVAESTKHAAEVLGKGTLEECVAACVGGLFSKTKLNCGGQTELIRQVMSTDYARYTNRNQKAGEVVVSRWEVQSPADRRLMLHKIRGDFDTAGGISEERDERLKLRKQQSLTCPQGKTVNVNRQVGSTAMSCAACDRRFESEVPRDCRGSGCSCGFAVCGGCYTRATTTKWSAHHAVGGVNV